MNALAAILAPDLPAGHFALQSDLPVREILGPYPILQFFAALIVVMALAFGALAYLRGEKFGRTKVAEPPQDGGVQIFMGGSLKAIHESLGAINAVVLSIQQTAGTMSGRQELNKLEYKDVLAQQLSDLRHRVMAAMADVQAELGGDAENNRRDVVAAVDALSREIRELRDVVIRIEAGLTVRRGR